MSLRRALGAGAPAAAPSVPWFGVSLPSLRQRRWLPVAAAAVGCALALAALRVDLIRVRYGLADALAQERALLEGRRAARAQLLGLRDPTRLSHLAADRGFVRPVRIIDLGSEESP